MQLWQRITLTHAIMFALIILVLVVQYQQFDALSDDVAQASEEYEELRTLAAGHAALIEARTLIEHDRQVSTEAQLRLSAAIENLKKFLALQPYHTTQRAHQDDERELSSRSVDRLQAIVTRAQRGESAIDEDEELMRATLADITWLNNLMDTIVSSTHEDTAVRVGRARKLIAIAPGLALVLGIVVGLWQYYGVVRPVRRLRHSASAMAAGDFSSRIDQPGHDEIAGLAGDFNRMAGELELLYRDLEEQVRTKSRELAHAERLASVGFLAAGFAHEINNPLAIIQGYAQEAKECGGGNGKSSGGPSVEVLDVILSETRRCRDIVRKLLSLASPSEPQRSVVGMDELATEVIALVRDLPKYRDRRIRHIVDSTDDNHVMANAPEVKQVLLNLLINALEATRPEQGLVEIKCCHEGAQIVTEVRDNGCGMSAATLGHVFDPFFTTRKGKGETGVGLGLSISHAIIEQHGGTLSAHSDGPDRGSRFTIRLPAVVAVERK